MNCPICDQDLTILDLISATEHVNTCVEHGPSVIEIDDSGQIVVKKNLPPGKQRKICPICDKTFQNLTSHYKTCALKHDVPPDLMLKYWDDINLDSKKPKKFPRDLLTSYISKCIKEGRIGEHVDYARALVLSLYDGDPEASNEPPDMQDISQAGTSDSMASSATSIDIGRDTAPVLRRDVTRELLHNAAHPTKERPVVSRQAPKRPKFRIESVDEFTKRSNIALRIDRELAASRIVRYKEVLHANAAVSRQLVVEIKGDDDDDDECMIVQDNSSCQAATTKCDPIDPDKLFFLARLKDCHDSELCKQASCIGHELHLLLDDFKSYSGKSMDAPPATPMVPLTMSSDSELKLD